MVITHWDQLRDATETVWNAIKTAIETVVEKITKIIDTVVGKIRDAINAVKDFAKNIPFIGGLFSGSAPALSGSSSYLLNASSAPLGDSPSVVVNVQAGVGDPVAIARTIEATLRARGIRLGVA